MPHEITTTRHSLIVMAVIGLVAPALGFVSYSVSFFRSTFAIPFIAVVVAATSLSMWALREVRINHAPISRIGRGAVGLVLGIVCAFIGLTIAFSVYGM